jgi:uncharacterized membrane protein
MAIFCFGMDDSKFRVLLQDKQRRCQMARLGYNRGIRAKGNAMNTQTHEAVQLLAQRLLDMGYEEIPARERLVIERVAKRLAVSRNINIEHEKSYTFGERLADRVASFGGSWTFLILFAAVIIGWVMLNSVMLAGGFDPYPYILLNLFLSMLASIQAPVIMMSQNRQAAKDRLSAAHDYEVNLKAEIEIMALHEKIDEIRAKDLTELLKHVVKGKRPSPKK